MSKKIKEHQNKPYYINNSGSVEIKPVITIPEPVTKFRLGIDKNNNPLITIDDTIHFFNSNQFHAFTLGIININKKINPEMDYSNLLM